MTRSLTESELLEELFEFEKAESVTIERNGPGRWSPMSAWNAPTKDRKISRPLYWKPSTSAWEALADKEQAPYRDGSFYGKNEGEDVSREVSSSKESVSKNAQRNRRAGKSSSTHRDGFDFETLTI